MSNRYHHFAAQTLLAREHLNFRLTAGHNSEPSVAGDEHRIDCFGKREIGGIVGRAACPELPNPLE